MDEMKFATRKYKAPYGLEQVEVMKEGNRPRCSRSTACGPDRI